jgi:DNA-binding transcriptional ArsR family regulator
MTKPSISHHLNILKESELVFAEKKGQQIYYSVNTTVFEDILKFAAGFTKKGGKVE